MTAEKPAGQASPELHPLAVPLRPLLGTWRGQGAGSYPTIESFEYREEVTFGHVGKPFLAYGQKTQHAVSGLPLHAEHGYYRPLPGSEGEADSSREIEVVLVHPTGILESLTGMMTVTSSGLVFELSTALVTGTATAVPVEQVTRRIEVVDDALVYDVAMAAAGQPLTHHLHAELTRVTPS